MRRIPALTAIFAVALNALWPLIAQAQPREPLLVAVVCATGVGTHAIDLTRKRSGGAGQSEDHCKLCVAGGAALPVWNMPVTTVPVAAENLSGANTPVFFPAISASPAPPRGPPAIL